MDSKDFERLGRLLDNLSWYVETFIASGMGLEWDTVPGRSYYATPWMEFFKGINDGSYHRLSEAITDSEYMPRFREEVNGRLAPLLAELEAATVETGKRKIPVRIDVGKFRLYETELRQMSTDNIIFDLIQDDDDIRDAYYVEESPAQIRSYLTHGIRYILDQYNSAELERIRELENRLKEKDAELGEKNIRLALLQEKEEQSSKQLRDNQTTITTLTMRNELLEKALSQYEEDEEAEDTKKGEISLSDIVPIKDANLRMYALYKLGFLDRSIWRGGITYEQEAKILRKILGGGPIKQDTALRYCKLFNGSNSSDFVSFEMQHEDELLKYLKHVCPKIDFKKGELINRIRKY
ncbi:hypothetical protein [Sphingobacterium hotanense]|uniref:hypothetical protein n=1 Tax=Sphingobacterium hotanense TaxID=649196 RepID=UPI0021A4652C|nr:hypothetical protein [Sphingobacterium hotanense]MCT1526686.1 hypothetical protein [Sphingobacterium hotanense]